nr:hypothetical protein [Tanacetum cinerariifolium]
VNDVTRLQALVDKKKVIITKAINRDALRLDDAEGIECLPNEEIFIELSRMRVGKGFSRVDTPLFEGMIVTQEVGEGATDVNVEDVRAAGVVAEGTTSVANDDVNAAAEPSKPSPTPPAQPPPPSQDIPSTSQGKEVGDKEQAKSVQAKEIEERGIIANIDADEDVILEDAKEVAVEKTVDDEESEPTELQKVVEVVTTAKLITKVVTAASETIAAADIPIPATIITDAASTLTTAPTAAKRRNGVVIRDPEETSIPSTIIHTEPKSKDNGKGIMVHEPKPLKKKTQIKGKSYDDIRPIFEKYFNSNVALLEKTKEQMDEEDIKALKGISESQEDKAAKR